MSGIDLLDGTPVLDIKPYIFDYDSPKSICDPDSKDEPQTNIKPSWIGHKGVEPKKANCKRKSKVETIDLNVEIDLELVNELHSAGASNAGSNELNEEIKSDSTDSQLQVHFTARSEAQLRLFHCKDSSEHSEKHLINDPKEVKNFYLNFCKKRAAQMFRASQTGNQKRDDEQGEDQSAETDNNENDQNNSTEEESTGDLTDRSLQCKYCFEFLSGPEEAKRAMINTLIHDPRSAYRRSRGVDKLYYFALDTMHITAWFDEEERVVEVIKIKPNYVWTICDLFLSLTVKKFLLSFQLF